MTISVPTNRTLSMIAFAQCGLISSMLHAQTSPPADTTKPVKTESITVRAPIVQEDYSAPRSSTATKTDASNLEIPQAVNVVNAQILGDQQARSLDDALKNVSGVTMGNNFGHTRDSHFIRGFSGGFFGSSGSVLRDGIRSMSSRSFSITTDRVEVLKGPASLLYGILDPGGVINVISKKPLSQNFTQLGMIANSYGGGASWFDVSRPVTDTLATRVIVEHERSEYWRNFGDNRRTLIAPSLAYQSGPWDISLNYEYLDFDVPFDRGTVFFNGRPLNVPIERRFGEPYERMNGIVHLVQSQAIYQVSPSLKLRGTFGWNSEINSDRRAMVVSPSLGLGTTGIITRSIQGADDRTRKTLYASFDSQSAFDVAGLRHKLMLGVDYESIINNDPSFFRRRGVTGFNIFNPVYGQLPLPTNLRDGDTVFWQTTKSDAQSTSVFAQDSISITNQWIAVVGARYQRSNQYADNQNNLAVVPAPVVLDKQTNSVFLPNVGLVYKAFDGMSLYVNHSRSFRPNATSATALGPFDPETGVVYEVGVKLESVQGLSGTVAVYQIDKENVLVSDGGLTRAVGAARSSGIEIDIAGQLTRNLGFIGTYAYTDATVKRDRVTTEGKRLPGVAKNVASLYLNYRIDSWSIGGGLRHVGKSATDPINSYDLDAYTVADLHSAYQWKIADKTVAIRLSVKNLLNKVYYSGALAGPINLTGGGSTFIGEPRQVLLQASLTF